jgi:hypothetical protein
VNVEFGICCESTKGEKSNRMLNTGWSCGVLARSCSILALFAVCGLADNSVTVTEMTGSTQTNRPFTISRVFAKGEIANYPRPSIGGTELAQWQTNVLSRWSDGSVKQALISFFETLPANGAANVLFVNDSNPCYLGNQAACDAAAPTQAQILGFDSSAWDADIETTAAASTHTTDARVMLSNGSWRFWIKGPLANEVIVEDRTPAHTYDYGYKDARYTRPCNGCAIGPSDTAVSVLDAGDIAAETLPAAIQIDAEKMIVSSVNTNTNVLTISARGYNPSGVITAARATTSPATGNPAAQLTATDARVATQDTVVISGATGCWAAINGTWSYVSVQRIDVNTFDVEANVSSCTGPLTGAVAYSTTSSSASAHAWYTNVLSLDQPESWVAARNASYNSLHPIFVLTEYTGWAGVKVEYILENDWVDRQQDQKYSVVLKNGPGLSNTVYSKASYLMASSSRWRKTYWSGSAPGNVNVDFNFAYMVSTKVIPNYDTSLAVQSSAVTAEYNKWLSSDGCDLGGHGEWQTEFDAVGGRPDLGVFPLWTTLWLYTQNAQMYADMMGNAACAPQINVHQREDMSGGTYWYDAAHTVSAFGHEISIYSPRGAYSTLSPGLGSYSSVDDFPYPVANADGGGANWKPDVAHQASFAFIPYIVTGDWYWYEETLFWSIWDCLHDNSGATDGYGFLTQPGSEPRGLAWGLRNVAEAAFASPDAEPSAAVHKALLDNNIAYREGVFDITNGSFYNPSSTSQWYYGFHTISGGQQDPLRILRQLGHYDTPVDTSSFDPTKTCGTGAPWQDHLNIVMNGVIEDMGFTEIDTLRKDEAALIVHEAADPAYNPYLAGAYHAPAATQDGICNGATPWIQTWGDMSAAWLPSAVSAAQSTWNTEKGDGNFGYPNIARAAGSYATDVTDGGISGSTAWTWLYANANDTTALETDPQWAFLPRSSGSRFGACDLNGDSSLSVLDVVIGTSQVLGTQPCSTADLNHDGQCNVVDIQILVNAVLQQSCPVQ